MKKKKKREFDPQKLKKLPASCFISIFCLCLEPFLPAMKPATAILVRGILILPTLISLLLWSREMEIRTVLFGIIPLLAFAFLPVLLSPRLFLLVWLLLFLILVVCTFLPLVRCSKKKKKDVFTRSLPLMTVDLLMIFYCLRTNHGSYPGDGGLKLFLISLIVGMLLSAFICLKWSWKNLKRGMRIISFLSFSLGFASIFFFLSMTANYAFDFNDPVSYTAVIEQKRYDGGGRRNGHYEFQVTVDGKDFDLEVPYHLYNAYEEGDEYTFQYYKGAFGVPFYISED